MNRLLLLALMLLCLQACAIRSIKDDSPASDLTALETSVSQDLQPRLLPNGLEYCAELAQTERVKDECTGDLEDGLFLSNRDKARALSTLHKGLERLRLARQPCGLFDLACHRRQRALANP